MGVQQCLHKMVDHIIVILTNNLTIFRAPHKYNLTYMLSNTSIIIHIYTQTHINAKTYTYMHNKTNKNIPTHTHKHTCHTHTHSYTCKYTNKNIFLLLQHCL